MPYRVDILNAAQDEIIENTLYVMEKWGQAKAEASYAAILAKLALLATQPKMGVVIPELIAVGKLNYRLYAHETHTKFLYELDEVNEVVTVHMVFSSNQDFQSLLYRRIISQK